MPADLEMKEAGPRRVRAQEDGSALVWALVFVIITSGLVVSHTTFLAARRGERDARHVRGAMADTFAQSGLQDALGWFHSRSDQPISVFDPVNDPTGRPPRIETADPAVGLVREFEIHGGLWGRYEVRRDEVVDISAQRGDLVPGSAWEIGVRGYVYRRRDPSVPFDQSPNELLGTKAIASELRWLQINPPATAAVCIEDPAGVTVGAHATLSGAGGSALAWPFAATGSSPKTADIDAAAALNGYPATLEVASYEAGAERVFGMRLDELRSYSDFVLSPKRKSKKSRVEWKALKAAMKRSKAKNSKSKSTDKEKGDPDTASTVPSPDVALDNKLLFVDGLELDGSIVTTNSLIVVDGDLTSTAALRGQIDGVVYVTGNAVLNEGMLDLGGALIVRGKLELAQAKGSSVSVRYDADVLTNLRRTIGKYRNQRGNAEN